MHVLVRNDVELFLPDLLPVEAQHLVGETVDRAKIDGFRIMQCPVVKLVRETFLHLSCCRTGICNGQDARRIHTAGQHHVPEPVHKDGRLPAPRNRQDQETPVDLGLRRLLLGIQYNMIFSVEFFDALRHVYVLWPLKYRSAVLRASSPVPPSA